jgi:hypothetical protein
MILIGAGNVQDWLHRLHALSRYLTRCILYHACSNVDVSNVKVFVMLTTICDHWIYYQRSQLGVVEDHL